MTTILIVAAVCIGGGGLVAAFVYMTQRRSAPDAGSEDDFAAPATPAPASDWSVEGFSDALAADAGPAEPMAGPRDAEEAPLAPAISLSPAPAPSADEDRTDAAEADEDGLPPHIEKIRVPDVGLLAYVHAVEDGPEPLLGFSTEGFAAVGRPELVLYLRRADIGADALIPALKRFTAVALTLFERQDPLSAGETLPLSGTYGAVALGGFVVMDTAGTGTPAVHVLVGVRRGVDPVDAKAALAPGSFVSPVG